MLHGSKQSLKYKIKLNDQILDPNEKDNKSFAQGKLVIGSTVPDNQMMKIKK